MIITTNIVNILTMTNIYNFNDALSYLKGYQISFNIGKKCKLSSLSMYVSQSSNINIKRMIHMPMPHNKSSSKVINDNEKFLIEDYNIQDGDIILIISDNVYINLNINCLDTSILLKRDNDVKFQINIGNSTTIKHILDFIKGIYNDDIINKSLKLYFNGKLLFDENNKLKEHFNVKNNDVIEIKIIDFPSNEFIKDIQIYYSDKCIICSINMDDYSVIFGCGHVNVCSKCIKNLNNNNNFCPQCVLKK